MEKRINFGEIREALDHNNNLARKSLLEKEDQWGIYDSSIRSFGATFLSSLPEEYYKDKLNLENLESFFGKYIEETLSKSKGETHDLTAIEFGGPGSNLFKGFNGKFFKKTIGVCLKDIRDEDEKDYDEKHNHFLVTGDIFDVQNTKLSSSITETLGTEKVDLIISRMVGPLDYINPNPAILDRIIRNWYNMLNKNGLIFIQYQMSKKSTGVVVEKWSTRVKEMFPEIDISITTNTIRIHKKTGAPDKLPPATELFAEIN